MFLLYSSASVFIDSFIVILFFQFPYLYSCEGTTKFLWVVVLASLRITSFVPILLNWKNGFAFQSTSVSSLWLLLNVLLVFSKLVIFVSQNSYCECPNEQINSSTQENFQVFLLIASLISIVCQYICLRHVTSSAVSETSFGYGGRGQEENSLWDEKLAQLRSLITPLFDDDADATLDILLRLYCEFLMIL